jgi:hypothetical protein
MIRFLSPAGASDLEIEAQPVSAEPPALAKIDFRELDI